MITDTVLLILRVFYGGALFLGHGIRTIRHFSELQAVFPDPFGIGHSASLFVCVFVEVVCSGFVTLGAATRVAAVPVVLHMMMAGLWLGATEPWLNREVSILYAVAFFLIFLAGPDRISLDSLFGWLRRR